ncbi:MAG: B12-binding domain-containing radical SAM protein [Promethearchaeota archaeon]
MGLKILLINPNRMKTPPVIPIGLEYLKSFLQKHQHYVKILDLCFTSAPEKEIRSSLTKKKYDIVGFTIRNIDSSIYFNNEFYLAEIKKLVQCVKDYDIPIIIGGTGFSAMPEEILNYLEADYGIVGPGDIAFQLFLDSWQKNSLMSRIINGWQHGPEANIIHRRGTDFNYSHYVKESGVIGFQTHFGCMNKCPYCIEAGKPFFFRKIESIIEELRFLVEQGYDHFHLCDSEFNNDLSFSIDFCLALKKSNIPLKWILYMKPTPYNEDLFRLLGKTNAYLITLSVDTDKRLQALNSYSYQDLKNIINYCKKFNIRLAIDLMTGYPGESLDSTKKGLNFFKKYCPDQVGIGFYYRLVKGTPLTELVINNSLFREKLTREIKVEDDFLQPVFYAHLEKETLENLIEGERGFSISGLKPGVNYQKV